MERGLVVRQHLFGADSEEVWGACRSVGELCNMLAMSYLQQGERHGPGLACLPHSTAGGRRANRCAPPIRSWPATRAADGFSCAHDRIAQRTLTW